MMLTAEAKARTSPQWPSSTFSAQAVLGTRTASGWLPQCAQRHVRSTASYDATQPVIQGCRCRCPAFLPQSSCSACLPALPSPWKRWRSISRRTRSGRAYGRGADQPRVAADASSVHMCRLHVFSHFRPPVHTSSCWSISRSLSFDGGTIGEDRRAARPHVWIGMYRRRGGGPLERREQRDLLC